jgi:hypothetical protein
MVPTRARWPIGSATSRSRGFGRRKGLKMPCDFCSHLLENAILLSASTRRNDACLPAEAVAGWERAAFYTARTQRGHRKGQPAGWYGLLPTS